MRLRDARTESPTQRKILRLRLSKKATLPPHPSVDRRETKALPKRKTASLRMQSSHRASPLLLSPPTKLKIRSRVQSVLYDLHGPATRRPNLQAGPSPKSRPGGWD